MQGGRAKCPKWHLLGTMQLGQRVGRRGTPAPGALGGRPTHPSPWGDRRHPVASKGAPSTPTTICGRGPPTQGGPATWPSQAANVGVFGQFALAKGVCPNCRQKAHNIPCGGPWPPPHTGPKGQTQAPRLQPPALTGQTGCIWLAGASTFRCSTLGQGVALGQQRGQPTHGGTCRPGCTGGSAQAPPQPPLVAYTPPLQHKPAHVRPRAQPGGR